MAHINPVPLLVCWPTYCGLLADFLYVKAHFKLKCAFTYKKDTRRVQGIHKKSNLKWYCRGTWDSILKGLISRKDAKFYTQGAKSFQAYKTLLRLCDYLASLREIKLNKG